MKIGKSISKLVRSRHNPYRQLRKSIGLHAHSKLGRSLKHMQRMFSGSGRTLGPYSMPTSAQQYQYQVRTLSQLTGGV